MAVRGRGARRPEQQDEIKVIGLRAAEALIDARPADVVRAYLSRDVVRRFGKAMQDWAARRVAYHVVEVEELDRVAGSMHHEGVCLLALPREMIDEDTLVERASASDRHALLFLDRVDNPNNVGAIVRVAAHFGVPAVLYSAIDPRTFRSSAVHRTAEGGAEHVELLEPPDPAATLRALAAAGTTIVATSGRGDVALYGAELPEKAVFLLGAERDGLSPELLALADRTLAIPGSGWVESLNVACAASTVLGEWWRQHEQAAPRAAPGPSPKARPRTKKPR